MTLRFPNERLERREERMDQAHHTSDEGAGRQAAASRAAKPVGSRDHTIAVHVLNDLLQEEIEQRRRWAEVLQAREAQVRGLLQAMPDALLQLDLQGRCLDAHGADGTLLGLPLETFRDQRLDDVLPSSLAHRFLAAIERASESETLQVFECTGPVAQERSYEVRIGVSGKEQVFSLIRDVTDRRRLEAIKNEFISIVSHELRTPLTSISGALALIAAGITGPLPEPAREMIDVAHRNSERLVRLINELLDFQKIESGTMPFDFESLDLVELIERALEENESFGHRYDVTFDVRAEPREACVVGDSDRLVQVLTNLLSNAAKFSPAGSVVTVGIEAVSEGWRVWVRDTGPGIPEHAHTLVFQKFMQVDASTTRNNQGSGLGLSICKSIIERHGGRIDFTSSPEGGTMFFFDLPVQRYAGGGPHESTVEP